MNQLALAVLGDDGTVGGPNGSPLSPSALSIVSLLTVNNEPQVYGKWLTIGNAPGSVSIASPTSAPGTTLNGSVTLPLTNATVPVADCAHLDAHGGSFTIGGFTVGYKGRSASSGAGNATGCFTYSSSAAGTFTAGTTLGNVPIGFFPSISYFKAGDHVGGSGAPVVGAIQAGGAILALYGPPVDNSGQANSSSVVVEDLVSLGGSPFAVHRPIVGDEADASIFGSNAMPDGYTAPLLANGSRHVIGANSDYPMVKNAIGYKLALSGTGSWDFYDGLYQDGSFLKQYGTLDADITFPVSSITLAAGGTPPVPTSIYPTVSARVGGNGQGIGGSVFTYTGVSVIAGKPTLTGVSGGAGTHFAGDRVANTSLSINVQDPIETASGLVGALSGYSGSITLALKGAMDADNSMLLIQGPNSGDFPVTGGLTQLRLIPGSGQAAPAFRVYDNTQALRFHVNAQGNVVLFSVPLILQQSGTNTTRVDPGYLQSAAIIADGAASNAAGPKIMGGGFNPDSVMAGALGDRFQRSDTPSTANQREYVCTTAGVAGAARWTGIL